MAFVLQDIKVNAEIAKALQGFDSRYRQVFEVALDYEWDVGATGGILPPHRTAQNFLPDLYLRSVTWVSEALAEVPVTA